MFESTGASDCDADGYVPETHTATTYGYDYYGYYDSYSYSYSYTTNGCSDSEYLYFWVLWATIAIMGIWIAPIGCGICSFCAAGSEAGAGGTVVNQQVAGVVVPGSVAAPPQQVANVQSLSALRAQLQSIATVKDLRMKAAAVGVPPHLIEDARDADNPRAAIIELIVNTCSKQPGWGP